MFKDLDGTKLVEPRIEHFVHYRGRPLSEGVEAIDSREDFLSRAKERAIDIPDDSDGFYFFDIFSARIVLPNGYIILVQEKMIRNGVYYYEGEHSDDPGYLVTRFGEKVPIVREGDQII